jgi:Uma2 family endonuclease
MAALPFQHHIDYPESDGKPLGETPRHRQEIVDLIYVLEQRYREMPDVCVEGNMFLYYERGNRGAAVCPDVFLVKGVDKKARDTFKVWEEGNHVPSLVIEVTSASTCDEDLIDKKATYANLGVEEYFLFDPLGEYLSPPLQGFRLLGNRYRPIQPEPDGSLRMMTTGLKIQREGQRARLVDAATGEPLRRMEEVTESERRNAKALRAAEARAAQKAEALRAAEEEIARLRRQLAESQNR